MNIFKKIWSTFVWQPVPNWPRVKYRGGGSPDNAAELVEIAMNSYQQAFLAYLGHNPPPVVKKIRIVFHDKDKVRGSDNANIIEGKMSVATLPLGDGRDSRIIRLIGHERLHHDLELLNNDPDINHDFEGFNKEAIPHMMTNPDHSGWSKIRNLDQRNIK